MSEMGKSFLKKSDIKIRKKNKKIGLKMPHVNKKQIARNGHLVQTKT